MVWWLKLITKQFNADSFQNLLLTFKKTLELTQSLDAAARNTKKIQNHVIIKINGITGSSQDNLQTELIGRVAQNAYQSWSLFMAMPIQEYHNCGKVGHIKKACCNKLDRLGVY